MRQLHALGIAENYGPKPARTRVELARFSSGIRKTLWRRPGRVLLWVERNPKGRPFFAREALLLPYAGWAVCLGGRALVCLTGSPPS